MYKATTTLIAGRRKFGKSLYLKQVLIPAHKGAVVVLDPKGEYGPEQGFHEIYYTADDFLDAPRFSRASVRVDASEAPLIFECVYYYSPHLFVVEEAHLYASPHGIEPNLSRLVRMGAEPGVSLVLVSQRVRDFPQIVYSMADKIIIFQQRSKHDVEALREILDDDAVDGIDKLARDEHRDFDL